ncbi:MAG: hypothetical protein A2X58_04185 [Nitrospirae bacterium GWC2_56_14]|nr:MAG: hypothetical protein A2X58_04185 [Nitrospirae bacterium GWC2_56_14]
MKINRHNRKNRTVLLLCLLLVWGLCREVRAEEPAWQEYRTTAAEGKLSYDPKSVAAEDNVVDVWSRFEPVADGRIGEMKHWVRFDCARKRMKLLKTITVHRDGSTVELPQKGKFEPIEPGSNPAILRALVCGEKVEPTAASQEPVAPPAEKPHHDDESPVAPLQAVPQEPAAAPVEKPLTEVQPPAQPQHQEVPPVETQPIAPVAPLQ